MFFKYWRVVTTDPATGAATGSGVRAGCRAGLPEPHVEYFHDHQRIERTLFDGALDPNGGTLTPDPDQPGLGLTLREPDAERYRRS
jgi:hypothetical protein